MPATRRAKNPKLTALLALYASDTSDMRAFTWILKALKEADGNVDLASQKLEVTRQTLYKWFHRYPDLRVKWEHICYEAREKRRAMGRKVAS